MSSIKTVNSLSIHSFAKSIMIASFAFIFSLVPASVLAQNAGENDPVAIYKEAGINAQQEATIRKLAEDYDKKSSTEIQSLAQMLQELRDMAYQKTLNESGMIAKQEEINKIQSEMALEKIKLVIKIRGLLSSEQNEKLVAALQNRVRAEEQQLKLK